MENTLEKSTKDSSLAAYGYDMVLAITQGSLNAVLCEYLGKLKDEVRTSCYTISIDVNGQPVFNEMDYNLLRQRLGKDLFEMDPNPKNRTEEDNKILEKAYNQEHFSFAVRYKYGFLPQAVPQIIELSDEAGRYERQKVYYKMHFKQFEVIELSFYYGNLVYNKIVQDPHKPFIFNTQVNLSMQDLDLSDTPEEVKKEVKNMGANMFSIQQIFLDINTAVIQSLPHLTGLSESSPAYVLITSKFINQCWKDMHSHGKVVFHYAVKPVQTTTTPSIIPTDFDFCISPYRPKGTDEKEKKLYTLNYVIMSEGKDMPPIREFSWNWIEKDEKSLHGSIAINGTCFTPRIISLFHEVIAPQIKTPRVSITCYLRQAQRRNVITLFFAEETSKPAYKKKKPTLWEMDYSGTHHSEGYIGATDKKVADITGIYTLNSQIELAESKLIHRLKVTFYLNVTRSGATAEGNIYSLDDTSEYELSIDSYGRLSLNKAGTNKATVKGEFHNPDKIRLSVSKEGGEYSVEEFRKIRGQDVLREFTQLAENLNGKLKNSLSDIGKIWIFPGTRTFLFKEPLFSNFGDLTAHLNYKKIEK